jgi:hypothetical protein
MNPNEQLMSALPAWMQLVIILAGFALQAWVIKRQGTQAKATNENKEAIQDLTTQTNGNLEKHTEAVRALADHVGYVKGFEAGSAATPEQKLEEIRGQLEKPKEGIL